MVTNTLMLIISQSIHVSNHFTVCLELTQCYMPVVPSKDGGRKIRKGVVEIMNHKLLGEKGRR